MLTNAVIVDSTQIDLVSQATLYHGIVVIVATQVKDGLYHDWFLMIMFIPFVIEVFRCLHQSRWTNFCINMPTWRGEQRALEALFFQFCAHFIGKKY
jgi:hypothetical protein